MPFSWMPAAGLRHATAHDNPQRGDAITTLCGQFLTAVGWDKLPPDQQPRCPWADMPSYWATCWDCHDVWARVQELASADEPAGSQVPPRGPATSVPTRRASR